MATELYIDGKLCDLSKKEVITLSLGVNRLTDIQSRQGYYSNTFKLPKTANNLDIFGIPNELNSTDTKRWERLECYIITEGIYQVFGFAQLQSVQDDLSVVVKGGNADWIGLLNEKLASEANLKDLDHFPTVAFVKANRLNDYTNGFVYPDIDYGWFLDCDTVTARHFHLRPAVFMTRLVKQFFADIDYIVDSEIDAIPKYQKMVVPYSNSEQIHGEDWENDLKFKVQLGGGQSASGPITVVDMVSTSSPYFDNGNHIDLSTDVYANNEKVIGQQFNISLTATGGAFNTTFEVKVVNGDAASVGVTNSLVVLTGSLTAGVQSTFTSSFEWHSQGEDLLLRLSNTSGVISLDDGFLECTSVDRTVVRGTEWNVAANLPEMLQTDIIKHVVNSFGAIIAKDPSTNKIKISLFDSIPTNTAEDWSEKVDATEDAQHSFKYGDFKLKNYLEYTNNVSDDFLKEFKDLGRHTITVETESKGEKSLYKSPFSLVQRGRTLYDTLTKAKIDQFKGKTGYSTIIYTPVMSISSITTTGLVTVSSGALGLLSGCGVKLYDIIGALTEGINPVGGYVSIGGQTFFFPSASSNVDDRVLIVGEIFSDTEFQLQGIFGGSPVTSGNIQTGVMVDENFGLCVNVVDIHGMTTDDLITIYDADGSTFIDGGTRATNGTELVVSSVFGSRCLVLKQPSMVTGQPEYIDVTIPNGNLITEGNVRLIQSTSLDDAKPRIGYHTTSEDAAAAISLYDLDSPTIETYKSEVTYEEITWNVLAAAYWTTLSSIIEQPQMVKRLMRLSASDINQIDFSRPKWIEMYNCYFYLSYISQYKVNEVDSTDVELIRLP